MYLSLITIFRVLFRYYLTCLSHIYIYIITRGPIILLVLLYPFGFFFFTKLTVGFLHTCCNAFILFLFFHTTSDEFFNKYDYGILDLDKKGSTLVLVSAILSSCLVDNMFFTVLMFTFVLKYISTDECYEFFVLSLVVLISVLSYIHYGILNNVYSVVFVFGGISRICPPCIIIITTLLLVLFYALLVLYLEDIIVCLKLFLLLLFYATLFLILMFILS